MPLVDILQWNKAYAKRGEETRDEVWRGTRKVLVITCSCPDLTGRIEPALGLKAGQACVVRVAGAWGGQEGEELLRSVPLAVHLSGCAEVIVIGHDRCSYCPADRVGIRNRLKSTGLLDKLDDSGDRLLDALRGPPSPESGVRETVRMLREAGGVPKDMPVHGCLMDPKSGTLRVIDQDKRFGLPKPEVAVKEAPSDIPDLPLPELPDIPLPELPDLDLDAITSSKPPPVKKKNTYGSGQKGRGPVPFGEVAKMPVGQKISGQPILVELGSQYHDQINISTPDISFTVPDGPEIQGTGIEMDIPELDAKADVTARESVTERQSIDARKDVTARESIKVRRHLPETPRPTPTRSTPPQRPLGEREFSLEQAQQQPKRRDPRVDLAGGYITHRGTEYPLDPELQRALVKVMRFVVSELPSRDRAGIAEKVGQGASAGQPFGELLKLMIGPVLKLGKKRYAVINELLKVKEDLPRLDPEVSVAILEQILRGK